MLGETYESSGKALAGDGGFIVSHKSFDEGADPENYYPNTADKLLQLEGLSSNDTVLLTLLTFQLASRWLWLDDYLEISDIRGYRGDKLVIWGGEDFTNKSFEIYPIKDSITFKFVTWGFTGSAGFLIKYEGKYYIIIMFRSAC